MGFGEFTGPHGKEVTTNDEVTGMGINGIWIFGMVTIAEGMECTKQLGVIAF